jgi:hypothetical protein
MIFEPKGTTMKTTTNLRRNPLPVHFAANTRFSVALPAVPARGAVELKLDQFKHRLLAEVLEDKRWQAIERDTRRAADEAAALAWITPFPLLVLPILMEEKVKTVRLRALRQARIRWGSRWLLAEASHDRP